MFGQVAEPFNDKVSGTNKVALVVTVKNHKFILIVLENDVYGTVVYLLALGFTVISNVLLLNVLIAMFKWVQNINKCQVFEWSCLAIYSEKIQRVQDQSNELWRYQRFWLVNEFEEKTVFPPPFNVLCYLIEFIKRIIYFCKRRRTPPRNNRNIGKTYEHLEEFERDFSF